MPFHRFFRASGADGPQGPYLRALRWIETLRGVVAGSDRLPTLRRLRELHLAPVPARETRLEDERRAAADTLDAIEAGIRLTASRDWLDRLAVDAALAAGVRIPLHCPRCSAALRVAGRRGRVRVRCPRWRCRWRRAFEPDGTPG